MRIVGHRGAAGTTPENTIYSFRRGFADGAHAVELDVRLSRDGVVVCFHDERVDRVTNRRGEVSTLDWAELSQLEVLPGFFGEGYPGPRIPALEDVYDLLLPGRPLIVELKSLAEGGERLVDATLEIISRAQAEEQTRIISFDHELLRRVHRQRTGGFPSLGVLVHRSDMASLLPCADAIAAEALHPPHERIDVELLRQARDRGFLVNAWTVNTVEAARRLGELGVDEITTDYPGLLWELGSTPQIDVGG